MTASRQRLVSAIRGIAKTDDDIANAISKTSNRGGQPGSSSSASSGGEESRICCDGSTSGNANPGTSQRNPDDEDAGQDGLDADDPANLDMSGGSLTGLTDCATGEPACFDGADWIPPEGWDSPTVPPEDPTFDDTVYGTASIDGGATQVYRTCSQARGVVVDHLGECYDGAGCGDLSPGLKYSASFSSSAECNDTGATISGAWGIASCADDYDPICDEPAPIAESWPEDGCVNLAIKNGTIVGSKFDPENDGTYNTPMAELTLCDEFGNQVNIKPSADGGWKSVNGVTGEDGYLYNSQGEQIAHIDGSEYSDPLI